MTDPAQSSQYLVFFGTRKTIEREIQDRTILIVPSEDQFNDFGNRKLMDFRVRAAGGKEALYSGFIGFLEPEQINGTGYMAELLTGSDVVEAFRHRYFTMLPDMEAYRRLIKIFGLSDALQILKAMNDVVAGQEFASSSGWIKEAIRTDIFLFSFMRQSESYFAYKNAGTLLRGLDYEELNRLSEKLRVTFHLAGFKNEHHLEFDFGNDEILPKRIAVIIGKNGVGKSQALSRIVRAAIRGDKSLVDGDGLRPEINRLLAFAPTSEAKSVFPASGGLKSKIWYRRFSINRSYKVRGLADTSDLILQLARSDESIRDRSRWEIFIESLSALHNAETICLPLIDSAKRYVPVKDVVRGGEKARLDRYSLIDTRRDPVRVVDGIGYPLSSGEISFLRFSAQTSLYIENGSLLLIDEPETHLHPNFISQFAFLLSKLLAMTGSGAVIATHSVYFVREVFRDQVTVLRSDEDNSIVVEKPLLRTFGADPGSISFFVFGEDSQSLLASAIREEMIGTNFSWNELYAKYKDEVSLEFLNALRSESEGQK